jgi:L-2-hydroxyglutarate oxidase
LIEKEPELANHQTGHNRGIIHAGIYYELGSLKAKLCREGLEATTTFCKLYDLAHKQCGKLVVATIEQEKAPMGLLFERARATHHRHYGAT